MIKALPRPNSYQNPQQISLAPYNSTRKINFNEINHRKAKGLCFNCNEKFTPSHKCQNRRLLLLQWDEETLDSKEQDSNEFLVELEQNSTDKEESDILKLSLNTMNSVAASGTMRFTGYIKGQAIKVLLVGGSDDNFIQKRMVEFLKLVVQPTAPFRVLVGDGNSLQIEGKIEQLKIKIQDNTLSFLVYLLPIAGAKVIMGAAWLETFGAHVMDYRALSLQFFLYQKFVTLCGEKEKRLQST